MTNILDIYDEDDVHVPDGFTYEKYDHCVQLKRESHPNYYVELQNCGDCVLVTARKWVCSKLDQDELLDLAEVVMADVDSVNEAIKNKAGSVRYHIDLVHGNEEEKAKM